ncbi:MAG: hypothetical protein M3326_02445 [Actinomycetota bacterium]|nr:hypothetical protein [Actinomycetota bacterium]
MRWVGQGVATKEGQDAQAFRELEHPSPTDLMWNGGRERDARYVDMAAIDACRSVDEVVPGAATPSAGILCIHPEPSATGR